MTQANPLGQNLYLAARRLIPLIAPLVLRARRKRGKEHRTRWVEKCGQPSLPRPTGPLIWLHGVGLGEVMSLRGLIAALHDIDDTLEFLVTTSSLAAASAFAGQMPLKTRHQFLPLDSPRYTRPFLDHWQPDLVIWAEQDIWPGLIHDVGKRGIPQALINARMNAVSFAKHAKQSGLFGVSLRRMAIITAQDQTTADNLIALGADPNIQVIQGLKAAAPMLAYDAPDLARLRDITQGRRVWVTAPAYGADVDIALAAHAKLRMSDPTALVIIAPRDPALHLPIDLPRRSKGQHPDGPVWVADTLGELGLFYRLADTALIGGSFHDIQGHNPWEAAAIGCAILHGPMTANFAYDYTELDRRGGAIMVETSADIVTALKSANTPVMIQNAGMLIAKAKTDLNTLATQLNHLRGAQ
ncbi:MAG: 3-deoxy-D-manno-octulosonic acid transferase [Yoonia sp.]|nr:3-deoxy-D-manno-octulosonic acid transferase [Yoonia sp.]